MRERTLKQTRSTAAATATLFLLSMIFTMIPIQVTADSISELIWSPSGTGAAFEENLDSWGDWVVRSRSPDTACPSDLSPPTISDVTWSPSVPLSNEPIDVYAIISDEDGIRQVFLDYNDGITPRNLTMNLMSTSPPIYWNKLPALGTAGTIEFWIMAWDSQDNFGWTDLMYIEIQQALTTTTTITTTTTSGWVDPQLGMLVIGVIFVGLPAIALVVLHLTRPRGLNWSGT